MDWLECGFSSSYYWSENLQISGDIFFFLYVVFSDLLKKVISYLNTSILNCIKIINEFLTFLNTIIFKTLECNISTESLFFILHIKHYNNGRFSFFPLKDRTLYHARNYFKIRLDGLGLIWESFTKINSLKFVLKQQGS